MKNGIKILLVNVGVLLVGLVLLELMFGHWFNEDKWGRLSLVRNADLQFDVTHLYPSQAPARYTRDAYAFRGAYSSPSEIDILTVGGSTTDQRYITNDQTWQTHMAQTLADLGQPVTVVNGGVDGQSTRGHLKNFEWWYPLIPDFKPRYFLFFIGINDIFIEQNIRYDDINPSYSFESKLKKWIKGRSALYALFRTLRGAYRAQVLSKVGHGRTQFEEATWTPTPLIDDYDRFLGERLDEFEARLRRLIQQAGDLGAQTICVTQACRMTREKEGVLEGLDVNFSVNGKKVNGLDYDTILRRFNERTLQTCKAAGAIPIDLASELSFDPDDFYDPFHQTPQGTQKMGRYLGERVRSLF